MIPFCKINALPYFSKTKKIMLFTFPTLFSTVTCFLLVFYNHFHSYNSILISKGITRSNSLGEYCYGCTET